jgi:phage gp46-like protein
VTASASISGFKDSANVSSYAKEAMQWAVANGFVKGDNANALNPKGNATRVETATIIARFVEACQAAAK